MTQKKYLKRYGIYGMNKKRGAISSFFMDESAFAIETIL